MKDLKEYVKRVLSQKYVRVTRRYFGVFWNRFASLSYFISVPVSILNPVSFMREQRAVKYGKYRYYKGILKPDSRSMVGLRRNTHRLEKALVMQPRRDVFAKDYIMETVEWFKIAVQSYQSLHTDRDKSEIIWAHNVIDEYFRVVKHVGIIEKAFKIYKTIDLQPWDIQQKPFKRKKVEGLPTYKQILKLSEYRRSVRWFDNRTVDRLIIDKALKVARQSPTACNRMPYEFRIFDNPDLVRRVATIPFGTGGYAENIPVVAVVIGNLDSYFSARDRHAIYIDSSLAVMGFVYALESQGVSSCLINWPDFEPLERKMKKMLGLNDSQRPIMLIAIGYESDTSLVPRSTKKDLDTIRSYNKLSND